MDVSNTLPGYSGGAYTNSVGYVRNVTVESGGNFYLYNQNGNTAFYVSGNINNLGTIYDDIGQTGFVNSILTMNGTGQQTISGTGGVWAITGSGSNVGTNRIPGFEVNNTSGLNPAVLLNQSFAVENNLKLTNGILGGTGTLTLGIGINGFTLTTTVVNGAIPLSGGSTTPALAVNYNLQNMNAYNLNYFTGASVYTTGGELPDGGELAIGVGTNRIPISGTMQLGTNNGSSVANIKLARNATVYSVLLHTRIQTTFCI